MTAKPTKQAPEPSPAVAKAPKFIKEKPVAFPATVKIMPPGLIDDDTQPMLVLNVDFNYRTKTEFEAFMAEARTHANSDVVTLLGLIRKWDHPEPLNEASITDLLDEAPGSTLQFLRSYHSNMAGFSLKN